ncbi:MAG TPA: SRPBCC family protein [Gemmatimonadaceae bacterium]|nr:SRPBCC family protein [Gemmatimonadaceae bacterium]
MTEITTTVDIDATPNDVWTVLTDVERWPAWTPTMQDVRRLDRGPLAAGSAACVRQPHVRPAVYEVTRLDEGRGFTWVSRAPGITTERDHVLESLGGKPRVTLSIRVAGMLSGAVGWRFCRLAQRYIGLEAEGLRRRCEGTRRGLV